MNENTDYEFRGDIWMGMGVRTRVPAHAVYEALRNARLVPIGPAGSTGSTLSVRF